MAAGVLDNGTGIAGVGNCTLVPINNAYSDYGTDTIQMDAAIRWAADNGVRVVNLSWDGADSPTLNLAAEYLRSVTDGIVVMAGVNGSGLLNYTNQPYIIAVSMTDNSDALQSHFGPHIDFSAPGYQVYSTTVLGYATGSGTSYAAPLLSGIFASLFSLYPSLTAEEAISIIKATAVDLGPVGWDQYFGWGRVDFGAAAWLAAVMAGRVPDLGDQQCTASTSNLKFTAEFHPGMAYRLMGATNLNQSNWIEVPAELNTNGAAVEFSVDYGADAAFYRMIGELNF
jgi:subtilisin family serine protease